MNDAPRRTLRDLIAKHGPGLCSDARRCEGLLRDLCGQYRREINTLVSALDERVPLDLLAAQGSMPRGLLLARLAKRLEDHLALTGEAARWAVGSWALALGAVTEAELADWESKAAQASPPAAASPSTAPPAAKDGADDADDGAKKRPAPTTTTTPPPITRPTPTTPPQTPQAARHAPPPRTQAGQQPPPPQTPPRRQPTTPTRPPAQQLPTQPPPPTQPQRTQQPTRTWPPMQTPPSQPSQPSQVPHGGRPSNVPRARARRVPWPTQSQPPGDQAEGRRWSWRGCLVGCLLLVVLSAALFLGVPFVVSVLREEQQQRNAEPPPTLSR